MANRTVCKACHAAAWALSYYWRNIGLPLLWADRPHHGSLGNESFWREVA